MYYKNNLLCLSKKLYMSHALIFPTPYRKFPVFQRSQAMLKLLDDLH